MGWLISYTIASLVGALFVVRLFEYLVSSFASIAKVGLFVGVWTAITTGLGMRSFTKMVRQLRPRKKERIP